MNCNLSSLLFTVLFTACSTSSERLSLNWDVAQLPKNGELPHVGLAGPVTGMIGEKLLIAGGANFPDGMPWDGGKKVYQHQAYIYEITADKLTLKDEFAFADSIAYAAHVSAGGAIYSAGGEGEDGAVAAVWKYSLDSKGQLERYPLASLPVALTNGGLVFLKNTLYFVGGENAVEVSDKVYKLDLGSDHAQWEEFLQLPYPLTHAVVVSDSHDKIYIAGGRKRNEGARSDIYDAVFKIDIEAKEITKRNTLPQPLAAGTGVWLADHLIVIGGDDASTFHRVEDLLGEIGRMEAGPQKDSTIAAKNDLQRQHPGFSRAVWALNLGSNTWTQLEDIAGQSPVTTTAVVHGNTIIIPSGEVKAGVRTDQILIGKIEKQ
jgi:N-acetylneuraminic acid mutarotase